MQHSMPAHTQHLSTRCTSGSLLLFGRRWPVSPLTAEGTGLLAGCMDTAAAGTALAPAQTAAGSPASHKKVGILQDGKGRLLQDPRRRCCVAQRALGVQPACRPAAMRTSLALQRASYCNSCSGSSSM